MGSSERELKGTLLNRLRPPVSRSKVPDEPRAQELMPNTAHLGPVPSELGWKQDLGCAERTCLTTSCPLHLVIFCHLRVLDEYNYYYY